MCNDLLCARHFLAGTALMLAVAHLAGCAPRAAQAPGPEKAAPSAKGSESEPSAATKAFDEKIRAAAAVQPAVWPGEDWKPMFDGESLRGWRETAFAGKGEIECDRGLILLNMGNPFTGLNYTNPFPQMDYEVALEAMRVMGSDFFCGLTVPVGTNGCSLIVGGWGGSLLGISSLDGMDASENETTRFIGFESGRWYRIRLRITATRIEGWLDGEKLLNVNLGGRRLSVRPGDIEMSQPIGIAAWQTTAAVRNIAVRTVSGPAGPAPK